jgi:hypothetical protein
VNSWILRRARLGRGVGLRRDGHFAKQFHDWALALEYLRLDFGEGHPAWRSLPGALQISGGLHFEYANVAGYIRRALKAQGQLMTSDAESGFLADLAAHRVFCCFLPAGEPAREGESAPVVALDDQELLIALDDGEGCAQGSEQRESTVEGQAGACHDPEEAATQGLEGLQGRKSSMGKLRRREFGQPRPMVASFSWGQFSWGVKAPTLSQKPREGWGNQGLSTALDDRDWWAGDFKSTGRVFGWAVSCEVKNPTLSQKPREGWGNRDLSIALKMTGITSLPFSI